MLILSPFLKHWTLLKRRGIVAKLPTFGPVPMLFPATKRLYLLNGMVYAAKLPSCGPLWIAPPPPPLRSFGDPPEGRVNVAKLPRCGPMVILFPALKLLGSPRR